MESYVSVPRIVISAAYPGTSKSFLTVGLAVALRKKKLGLSCCVVGANLAQAALLRRTSGRFVRFLDERLESHAQIVSGAQAAGVGADLLLIDGGNSLYEGWNPGNIKGSDANAAALTASPVVLVVDGRRMEENLGRVIPEYCEAANGFDVAGVVVTGVDETAFREEAARYREVCSASKGSPVLLGGIPAIEHDVHLGQDFVAYRQNRPVLPRQLFVDADTLVEQHLDLEALIGFARRAGEIRLPPFENSPSGRRCRIAVTDDSCFNLLCFQDNLDILRYYGAEVVSFSPLADSHLPKRIGALYVTGAYLAEFGRELAENASMLASIRDFANAGGVIYSEGDGTAFLCRQFTCGEDMRSYPGVGLIRASALQGGQPNLTFCEASNPEDSIIGPVGLRMRAVGTNEWSVTPEARIPPALHVSYLGRQPYQEGFSPGAQILSTFLFTHWGSSPEIGLNLVDAATVVHHL